MLQAHGVMDSTTPGRKKRSPSWSGYNDADLAGDVDTRKSTSGIIYFLAGNPITW